MNRYEKTKTDWEPSTGKVTYKENNVDKRIQMLTVTCYKLCLSVSHTHPTLTSNTMIMYSILTSPHTQGSWAQVNLSLPVRSRMCFSEPQHQSIWSSEETEWGQAICKHIKLWSFFIFILAYKKIGKNLNTSLNHTKLSCIRNI